MGIEQYKSFDKNYGYNIALGGNGKRIVSERTKKKKKIAQFMTGRIPSEETRKRRSMIGKNVGEKNGMFGVTSEHASCAKLTFAQANEMRKEYLAGGTSSLKLAKKYGVSKRTVLNILHDKIYTC